MFTSGFYDSLNGDRKYTSAQMSAIFDGVIMDGVYGNIYELFATIPGDGMQVIVKTGRAWFNHTWSLNDSWMPLDIDVADVLQSRIDAVVLEVNETLEVRENSIKIVKGAPSVNPMKPALVKEGGVYQYALAYVTVAAEATSITEANIEIVVGQDETPLVTSPLKTVPIDDLFNQWNGEFTEWFNNLKAQLSDNVVANLQAQIDNKVDKSDKATASDIKAGTVGKWVDAKSAKEAMELVNTMEIGDITFSTRNLELLTNGKLIACDQRIVDLNAYPELKASGFLNGRVEKNPEVLSSVDKRTIVMSITASGTIQTSPLTNENGKIYHYLVYSAATAGSSYKTWVKILRTCINSEEPSQWIYCGNSAEMIVSTPTIIDGVLYCMLSGSIIFKFDLSQIENTIEVGGSYPTSNLNISGATYVTVPSSATSDQIVKVGNTLLLLSLSSTGDTSGPFNIRYSTDGFTNVTSSTFANPPNVSINSGNMGSYICAPSGYGLASPFCAAIQLDKASGHLYLCATGKHSENNNQCVILYRSVDNGKSWSNIYVSPSIYKVGNSSYIGIGVLESHLVLLYRYSLSNTNFTRMVTFSMSNLVKVYDNDIAGPDFIMTNLVPSSANTFLCSTNKVDTVIVYGAVFETSSSKHAVINVLTGEVHSLAPTDYIFNPIPEGAYPAKETENYGVTPPVITMGDYGISSTYKTSSSSTSAPLSFLRSLYSQERGICSSELTRTIWTENTYTLVSGFYDGIKPVGVIDDIFVMYEPIGTMAQPINSYIRFLAYRKNNATMPFYKNGFMKAVN